MGSSDLVPEYFLDEELGPIEVEVSDKEIEKILAPHLDDALSDTNDQEEDDEEIVFNAPNVGGSASALKKVHKTVSIHAVDFHLDGSGIINVLGTDATRDKGKLELVKETMISAASATTIRRFELSAEAADQQKPAVKEEVDYEGDDEGAPGVGELAVKPPPKKVAKTEAKMPTPRGTVAGFLAKEVASEVLKYTEVETAEQGTNTVHSGGKFVPPTTKLVQGPLKATPPLAAGKPDPPQLPKAVAEVKKDPPPLPKHVQEAEAMAKAVVASKSTAAPKIAAPPPPQERGGRPSGSSVPPKARPVQPMATTAAGGTPSASAGASSSDGQEIDSQKPAWLRGEGSKSAQDRRQN